MTNLQVASPLRNGYRRAPVGAPSAAAIAGETTEVRYINGSATRRAFSIGANTAHLPRFVNGEGTGGSGQLESFPGLGKGLPSEALTLSRQRICDLGQDEPARTVTALFSRAMCYVLDFIRFRGHFLKGGYHVHDASHTTPATAAAIHE
jgi:hypothetical protein